MSTRHMTTTTTTSTNHDNNLDALLEELQTSVSRPGSSMGMNGTMTGYREITRTVQTEGSGHPGGKTTEYHIEYLNPANSTTVLDNYGVHNADLGLLKQSELPAGSNVSSYKTVQYEYKTSGAQNAVPGSDVRMRQNITELDSLLDDLHTAQKTGFADSGNARHVQGIDPGLLEPIESSTPHSGHVSRSVEKRSYQEQRYGSVGRQSPARERERDVKKELVFTGGSRREQPSPSPIQQRKEIYRYETHKTTRSGNSRDMSPPQDRRQPSPSPSPLRNTSSSPSTGRQVTTVRSYNYSSDQDVPRASTMHRSPSPAGKNSTVRSYNYSTNTREYSSNQRDFSPDPPRSNRSQSPTNKVRAYNYNTPEPPRAPPPAKITSINSYNYSSTTRESNKDIPRTPPPHRSPSPVSFTQPPLPSSTKTTTKTYNFESSPRPQSPQPAQKFSPSDPSRTLTYQVSPPPAQPQQPTVITYKYSSTSTHSSKYPGEEGAPLLPRPFPTPSPTPEQQQQQQPPKKLDELMASFSDSEMQQHHETTNRYYPAKEHVTPVHLEATPPPAPPTPVQPTSATSSAAATAAAMQVKSKNITGPPVYYPPGVELFAKKEEYSSQQQSGGGMMKAKAKYEYEASSKSKSKSSSGKTVVPVCLPVCCAMPCSIL